jgi:hypothetical protein
VLSHPTVLCSRLSPPQPPASATSMALIPMKRGVKDIKRVSGRCVSLVFRSHLTLLDSSIVDDGSFRMKFGTASMLLFTTLPPKIMFSGFDLCDDGRLLDFHKQFWGVPLPPEHLDLEDSVHDPNDEENDDENGGKNDGDLLPESSGLPIIDSSWSRLLIRAEYLRIYNWAKEKYNGGSQTRPPAVVVTGQPGIGQYSFIDVRSLFF